MDIMMQHHAKCLLVELAALANEAIEDTRNLKAVLLWRISTLRRHGVLTVPHEARLRSLVYSAAKR